MHRTRDHETWSFNYHSSREEFLSAPRLGGAHSIECGGQALDMLVVDRRSPITLVAFHGAIPRTVSTYPRFDGQGIAKAASVNLVGVADPSIAMGVSLGWHLGNKDIGPLKPILSPLIRHVVESLETQRTILIGGSGGGFAAAHFAHDFPGSMAFLFNPRLSLNRLPRGSIRSYLKICHGLEGIEKVPSDSEREYLRPYGPTDIAEISHGRLNHSLLLYQNIEDENFLQTQFLPFVSKVHNDSRIWARLSHDGEGHVYIPRQNVQEILGAFSENAELDNAISAAGFASPLETLADALHKYSEVDKRDAEGRLFP